MTSFSFSQDYFAYDLTLLVHVIQNACIRFWYMSIFLPLVTSDYCDTKVPLCINFSLNIFSTQVGQISNLRTFRPMASWQLTLTFLPSKVSSSISFPRVNSSVLFLNVEVNLTVILSPSTILSSFALVLLPTFLSTKFTSAK